MMQKLPPLTAVRAFEAAARLESFSRAADEIHVTHSAVSHQIKSLEEFLGAALFVRQGRRVKLTDEGTFLAERVRSALNQIGEAAASIGRRSDANRLTVSVLPSFAARWLLPRIGRFMELHPDFEVSVHSSVAVADFARDGVDVAIRFGKGSWPKLYSELFMRDELFPVCSPKFNGGKLPKRPQDLAKFSLMRQDVGVWKQWFQAAGIDLPEPTRGVEFNDAALMLQSSIDGYGIALTRRSIAQWDLEKGTLVRLFDVAIPTPESYYLVWPEYPKPSETVRVFRDWLLQERQG